MGNSDVFAAGSSTFSQMVNGMQSITNLYATEQTTS